MPNQCAALGGLSDSMAFCAYGSCVMNVEKSAMKTQKSTMIEADHERRAAQQRADEVAPLPLLLGRRRGVGLSTAPGACRAGSSASRADGGVGAQLQHLGVVAELADAVLEVGVRAERRLASSLTSAAHADARVEQGDDDVGDQVGRPCR